MPYFKFTAGFDCGVKPSECDLGHPENCIKCISKKFLDSNFFIEIIELKEQQTEQKQQIKLFKHIWMKYQDISTIRHVIIIAQGGVPAFNMAIGDLPIDASLLCGFIQANISFSSKELTIMDKINPDKKTFEIEYKNFHVLLSNGNLCKVCLILDKRASNNLRSLLLDFTNLFEEEYKEKIIDFENTGDLSLLNSAADLIRKAFEITMIYPLTISSLIPPEIIENLSLIHRAVYECAKDLLKEAPYFFISRLIKTTSKLLGVISEEEILWNIHDLMTKNIIIWQNLEFERSQLETKKQQKQEREYVIQKIMEIKDLDDIIFECHDMSLEDAQIKINNFLKKGEIAEKSSAYDEAINEYQKALTYAKEFNMEEDIGKISFKILEIIKINRDVEFNFALEQASKSEKKKDYVIALKYLFQADKMLSDENKEGLYDKQLQKINKKIEKIQNYFK